MAEPRELRIPRNERELAQWIKESGADRAAFGDGPKGPADPLDEAFDAMVGAFEGEQPKSRSMEGRMRAAAREAGRPEASGTQSDASDAWKARIDAMTPGQRTTLHDLILDAEMADLNVVADGLYPDDGEEAA